MIGTRIYDPLVYGRTTTNNMHKVFSYYYLREDNHPVVNLPGQIEPFWHPCLTELKSAAQSNLT